MDEYDLIIIGAGTAGLPTSRLAAKDEKRKILLVGDGPIGGKCINTGCTPTKALIYATQLYKKTQKAKKFGIMYDNLHLDYHKVITNVRNLVSNVVEQNKERLKKFGNLTHIRRRAKFVNAKEIQINGETYSAGDYIIATGAKNFIPPIDGIDKIDYLTDKNIWDLESPPQTFGFVGGGFISCEFACAFNTFGSEVSVFEFAPRLIPQADNSISEELTKYMNEDGINIHTSTEVTKVSKKGVLTEVKTKDGESIQVDQLMIAAGLRGQTEGLNLDAAGVETDKRGYVQINDLLQTTNPHIWAIGDVVGKGQFTHMALRESKIIVNNIFSDHKQECTFEDIPYAVFTDPPIGSVGKTEQFLKEKGETYQISKTDLPASSRGLITGIERGVIKLIHFEKKIFGCHIIGEDADTLIHEIVPLTKIENGMEIFRKIIHAHPTLPEVFNNIKF